MTTDDKIDEKVQHVMLHKKAKQLLKMDECLRMINDEEDPAFWEWIELHIPDRATEEDLVGYMESMPSLYTDAAVFFAESMARILTDGYWSDEGLSEAFYVNPDRLNKEGKIDRKADEK